MSSLPLGLPAKDRAHPSVLAALRADFRAHGSKIGAQGFWALSVYRFGRWRYGIRPALLRKPFSLCYHILYKIVQVVTGIDLPCEVELGPGFVIDHSGGIVVSGYARFGHGCRLRSGVVIGLSRVSDPCAPVIGNNVDIGTGAKLLGRIVIGDNVLIGANAVVTRDVPANCIAVGVPAVVRPRRAGAQADEIYGPPGKRPPEGGPRGRRHSRRLACRTLSCGTRSRRAR